MILIDTNILIDAFRKHEKAVQYLSNIKNNNNVFISIITKMELIAGARNKTEVQWMDDFLAQYIEVAPSEKDLHDALQIMKMYQVSHKMGIIDSIIAATVISHNFKLITRNLKHFRFIPNIQLEQPYE